MPQNDDYLSRRHERREAAQKKREAESRRIRRTLLAAVLALAVCGVAFYKLTRDVIPEKPEQAQAVETTAAPTEAEKPTTPVQKGKNRVARITRA